MRREGEFKKVGREEKGDGKRKEGGEGGTLRLMGKKGNSSLKCVVSGCCINHIHILVMR